MDAIDAIAIMILIVGSTIGLSIVVIDIDNKINHIEDELRKLAEEIDKND